MRLRLPRRCVPVCPVRPDAARAPDRTGRHPHSRLGDSPLV